MPLLPPQNECCTPCAEPITTAIPGPPGDDGAPGAAGSNGVNAYSTISSYAPSPQPVVPAELGSVTVNVSSSAWMGINQIIYIAQRGYFQVTAKPTATSVTILNLEDSSTSAYATNSAPGTSLTSGLGISPGGLQGISSTSGPNLYSGTGSPEGVVTAAVGSIYTDTSTGDVYKKISGSGNTGWV